PGGEKAARRAAGVRRWDWVGGVGCARLLFLQSASTGAGGLLVQLPTGSCKVAHGLPYLLLSAFAALAPAGRPALALLAVLYGISDEIHQSFVPGRFPDLWDLVADSAGALLGAWLAPWLAQRLAGRGGRTRAGR